VTELADQQTKGRARVAMWRDNGFDTDHPVFYFGGYAGTGKTTVARVIADDVGGAVLFCAPTGKAAHVLTSKGCSATTIHKLIYTSAGDPTSKQTVERTREELQKARAELSRTPAGAAFDKLDKEVQQLASLLARQEADADRKGPRFKLNVDSDAKRAKLIVVDEASMVDGRIARDLESFQVPILALGDPAQLPPVGAASHWTEREPDHLLTQIHRQAAESPILQLATAIRMAQSTGAARFTETPSAQVWRWGDPRVEQRAIDVLQSGGQILVGRNKTRHGTNMKARRILGLGEGKNVPVPGDKLICLRNNHELGVLNGQIWKCTRFAILDDATGLLSVESEDGSAEIAGIKVWRHHFEGREDELAPYMRRECDEFAFGYAITVHKSQGSEWDRVVLFDESSDFRGDAWRHLYTGVTRAARELTVVRS